MTKITLVIIFLVCIHVGTHETASNESSSKVNQPTTVSPSTTTTTTTTSSSTETETTIAPTTSTTPQPPAQYSETEEPIYCSCDLHPSYCDIDCCCDHKCTDRDKRIFSRCISKRKAHSGDKSCYSTDIIYSVSSFNRFVSSSTQLFCVEWANVKKQDIFVSRRPFSSVSEIKKISNKHSYGWSRVSADEASSSRLLPSFLRSGDVVSIVRGKERLPGSVVGQQEEWTLPYSLLSGSGLCDSYRSIRFLESISTSCLRYILSLEENCQTFLSETYFEGRFVNRRAPSTSSTTTTASQLQSLTTRGTQESSLTDADTRDHQTQVQDCLPDRQCLRVSDNSYPSIKTHFLPTPHAACFNAVRKVSHEIFYDADNGIVRIETHFQRINLTGSRGYLRQFFDVKFTPTTGASVSTDEIEQQKSQSLSGNPGYLFAAPVLAAAFPKDRLSNESLAVPCQTLQLPVLATTDGFCPQSTGSAMKIQDVAFGVNFRSSCSLNIESVIQGEAASKVCQKLQKYLMSLVVSERMNVTHVGVLGNSNVSLASDWIPILIHDDSPQVDDAAQAAPLTALSRKCPYLVTGFSYQIYYSFTGLIDEPQAKILSVVRKYNSQSTVAIMNPTSGIGLEVSTSVSFFDMTHSRRSLFAPAPVLRLQLPADFFYPFFISSSTHPEAIFLLLASSFIILIPVIW